MSPTCKMAGYRKTFCTVSLPLGPDPLDDLRSATRMCSSGTWRRVALRQQASKHWQRTAAAGDPPPCQPSRQQSRKERSSGKTRELAGAREQRPTHPPRTTTSSHAATAAGSAARGSVSTATAGAAAPPQTDHGRNSIVSRDRRTPTIQNPVGRLFKQSLS